MDYPLPPEPAPNEPLRAAWGAQLIRWCRANRLLVTPGMLLTRTPNGTSYRPLATPTPSSSAAAAAPNPFDITITPNDPGDDDGATASIYPGLAAGLVADNVLDDLDVPTGDLSYVYVEITTDGTNPQSCLLKIATDSPSNASPTPVKNGLPVAVDVIVGIIDYTAPAGTATVGTYTPYRTFFPAADITLTAQEIYRVSATSPAPGALPYDIYYGWQIGSTGVAATGY